MWLYSFSNKHSFFEILILDITYCLINIVILCLIIFTSNPPSLNICNTFQRDFHWLPFNNNTIIISINQGNCTPRYYTVLPTLLSIVICVFLKKALPYKIDTLFVKNCSLWVTSLIKVFFFIIFRFIFDAFLALRVLQWRVNCRVGFYTWTQCDLWLISETSTTFFSLIHDNILFQETWSLDIFINVFHKFLVIQNKIAILNCRTFSYIKFPTPTKV